MFSRGVRKGKYIWGLFYYIYYKVWDEIPYPFPNFDGATVEVW